jgi:hypothetical protein
MGDKAPLARPASLAIEVIVGAANYNSTIKVGQIESVL